jgi:hypothetical protein
MGESQQYCDRDCSVIDVTTAVFLANNFAMFAIEIGFRVKSQPMF